MIKNFKLSTAENVLCSTTTGERKALITMLFFNTSSVAVPIAIHLVPNGVTLSADTQVAYWEVPPNDWAEWTADSKLILEGGDKVSATATTEAVINAFANFMVM